MTLPDFSFPMAKLNIVLVEPEIPPNTGNIARLCAATDSRLHLVHPLGFKTDDRHLRRAGLDYWKHVEVIHHENLRSFLNGIGEGERERLYLFSTRGKYTYVEANYRDGGYLLFGKETTGLPVWFLREFFDKSFFIPMWGKTRSINLATAVGIVTYHAYDALTEGFTGVSCDSRRPIEDELG